MKYLLISLSLLLLNAPALAQEAVSKVLVSLKDCQRLVKHKPRADVAYKAGVDVRGKSVVAAHGPGKDPGAFKLPDKITIDFGLDLKGKYGISGAGEHTATTTLFPVVYDLGMGGLTVNGKRLTTDDSQAIEKACESILNK
ncbi:MAG: hypothetical protein COB59_08535 [Rhodospirillaceae bacterium]|nr:MAG: hypothetical protein COB59_08535 [Rhodospirillaceae bacterium]